MRIRVENLPDVSEHQLKAAFEKYGVVSKVEFVIGRSVGLVEMPDRSEGKLAIRCLRGVPWGIRPLGLYPVAE